MFRFGRLLRLALPFEPMALTTLDAVEAKLRPSPAKTQGVESAKSWLSKDDPAALDSPKWFDTDLTGSPFFISPKHDGIRMVSYVAPPSASAAASVRRSKSRTRKRSAAGGKSPTRTTDVTAATTTFSRHGRALYGMFWIERELALLRALAGDPFLVLDGELYIHRPLADGAVPATSAAHGSAALHAKVKRAVATARRSGSGHCSRSDAVKTGFLAVVALARRLQGSSSQCATVDDILQYVATLPYYCLFDIAAYSPPSGSLAAAPVGNSSSSFEAPNLVAAELQRVRVEAAAALDVHDVEALRCIPNVTPFSLRLRTLSFFGSLLSRASKSRTLMEAYGIHQVIEAVDSSSASARGSARQGASSARRSRRSTKGPVMLPSQYKGGVFVKVIPYDAVYSLSEAKTDYCPWLEQQGYEGAVVRTATNTYAMREKRKGVIRDLVAPLAALPALESVENSAATVHGARRKGCRELVKLAAHGSLPLPMMRTYGGATALEQAGEKYRGLSAPLSHSTGAAGAVDEDSAAVARLAVTRAKGLRSRSETVVKLLPYKDKEFAVLRPLLKEPSTNPRTRPLVSIPLSAACPDGDDSLIKVDPSSGGGASGEKGSPRKMSSRVVFYGLQCLAENGKVFNVTMPKLSPEKQRQLLQHLLSKTVGTKGMASKHGRAAGSTKGVRSLTGTYVTIKYPSLTEYGVPRFGQVKAIRGGKGWHM